jgi:hypothetical protein
LAHSKKECGFHNTENNRGEVYFSAKSKLKRHYGFSGAVGCTKVGYFELLEISFHTASHWLRTTGGVLNPPWEAQVKT